MTAASSTAPPRTESAAAPPSRTTGSEVRWSRTIAEPDFGRCTGSTLPPCARRRRSASRTASPLCADVARRSTTSLASTACHAGSTPSRWPLRPARGGRAPSSRLPARGGLPGRRREAPALKVTVHVHAERAPQRRGRLEQDVGEEPEEQSGYPRYESRVTGRWRAPDVRVEVRSGTVALVPLRARFRAGGGDDGRGDGR